MISRKVKNFTDILNSSVTKLDKFVDKLDSVLKDDLWNTFIEKNGTINENVTLLKRIEEIQKKYEDISIYISKTFDTLKIECDDIYENKHFLFVNFDHQNGFKISKHSLPEIKDLSIAYNDIRVVVDKFYNCLNNLGDYLEVIHYMDTYCWVIDPAIPTYKDIYRRIVINDDVSAMITVDIYNAKGPPCIKLLGPSKFTDPLSEKLHLKITEWNSYDSFIDNLLSIFDLTEFLVNSSMVDDNNSEIKETECCICFSSRDENGLLPSVQCERTMCAQNFHSICLYQWLLAVSNNVQRFNTIHGECPCCSAVISCPIVQLKN